MSENMLFLFLHSFDVFFSGKFREHVMITAHPTMCFAEFGTADDKIIVGHPFNVKYCLKKDHSYHRQGRHLQLSSYQDSPSSTPSIFPPHINMPLHIPSNKARV